MVFLINLNLIANKMNHNISLKYKINNIIYGDDYFDTTEVDLISNQYADLMHIIGSLI